MIPQIKKNYSKEARLFAKKYDNIYDNFNVLLAKIDLISQLNIDDSSQLNYALYLYIEGLKNHLKGVELQLKREILEGTLKI
jgi:hypothetical protein